MISLSLLLHRLCTGSHVSRILATGVGCILVYAGISKMLLPFDFLHAVYTYQVFNAETGRIVAAVLPALEFVTGASLVIGMFRKPAAMSAAGLFLCFAGVRTWVVANGLDVSCGCFGVSGDDSVTWLDVATSLLLLSVTLVLAFQSIRTGTSTSIESQARNEAAERLGRMPQRGAESVPPAI